jgi:uncharacterized membrane protein
MITDFFAGILAETLTFLSAMTPIGELRIAIPIGYSNGLSIWKAFIFAVAGNMVPIFFLVYLLGPASDFLSKHFKVFENFFTNLFERTRRKHSKRFEYSLNIGLITLVAIPLPITGGWTGALAAFVFGIPPKRALLLIFTGILIAGVVVSLSTYGIFTLIG